MLWSKSFVVIIMLMITVISVAVPLWILWPGPTDDLALNSRFLFRAFVLCGVPIIYWMEAWAYMRMPNVLAPQGNQTAAGRLAEILAPLVLLCVVSNSLMGFFSMADEQYIHTLPKDSGIDVMRFGVAIVEPFPKMYFPLAVLIYAFWGAFIYNNYSFIRRLRCNDFAPSVFVAGALRLVLAILAAGLLYYSLFTDVYQYDDTGKQVLVVGKPDHAGLLVVGAFFAGLYPQQMITAIFSWFYARVTQLFPALGKYQYTPMTILQGVTLDVELRLKEEGIDSLQALAFCDPTQLAIKTPYSQVAIADWKDQAKLAMFFADGEQFATLASLGIRSYTALRDYQKKINNDNTAAALTDQEKINNVNTAAALTAELKLLDTSPIAKDKFQHFVRFGVFPP